MRTDSPQTAPSIELSSTEFIFGTTAGMRGLREEVERAIDDDLPVLIEGESGTGKEALGRFLHSHSSRGGAPFVNLKCAASPAVVMESEIYGSQGGAIAEGHATSRSSAGLSSGGTLFLDEIGDMELGLQRKLSEALVSKQYPSPDGSGTKAVDARFVAASGQDMRAMAQTHPVVKELLKPFGHHYLRLIPLRERKEDIPQLCEYLLGKFAREFGRSVPQLGGDVLEAFQIWKWPGNVRELENWIARIVIFGAEEAVGLQFSRQLVTWHEPELGRQVNRRGIGRVRLRRRHS